MPLPTFQGFQPSGPGPADDNTVPTVVSNAPTQPPAPHEQPISGHRPRHYRTAGTGVPAVAVAYASIDDQIRATVTSPTGRALLQLPDGTERWVEDLRLPDAAPAQAAVEPHPLQDVLNEFPEVAQKGSSANHRFHRAYKRAGSDPAQALTIARATLQG